MDRDSEIRNAVLKNLVLWVAVVGVLGSGILIAILMLVNDIRIIRGFFVYLIILVMIIFIAKWFIEE